MCIRYDTNGFMGLKFIFQIKVGNFCDAKTQDFVIKVLKFNV